MKSYLSQINLITAHLDGFDVKFNNSYTIIEVLEKFKLELKNHKINHNNMSPEYYHKRKTFDLFSIQHWWHNSIFQSFEILLSDYYKIIGKLNKYKKQINMIGENALIDKKHELKFMPRNEEILKQINNYLKKG